MVTEERWRIGVDKNVCQTTGMCVTLAARHFELRGGYSEPIEDEVEPDDDVIEAAENCPVEAIRVTAVSDGRLIAPEY